MRAYQSLHYTTLHYTVFVQIETAKGTEIFLDFLMVAEECFDEDNVHHNHLDDDSQQL